MSSKVHKRYLLSVFVVLLAISAFLLIKDIAVSKPRANNSNSELYGCYEFDECLYMNPLSSFLPVKASMPYIYGLDEETMIIANIETGDIQQFKAQYENTAVAEDEFSFKVNLPITPSLDISHYTERRLRAVLTGSGQQYRLYQMDNEIWLVKPGNEKAEIWSIYRLKPTDQFTLADLKKGLDIQKNADGKKQMSLRDVYELARKGKDLSFSDLDAFSGKPAGSGFMIMRYDIQGGFVLIVHADTPDSPINYARLSKRGYDPFDESLTVDIREGAQAVAAYLDPLHSLDKLKIEDPHHGIWERELIYEFDGYRYYLNTKRADQIYITFENGDRLPLKQALEERRTTIEDLVANGLRNIIMEPAENPMNGSFTILQHLHKFSFESEAFYPSPSFMYVNAEVLSAYFDIEELADILALQGRDELSQSLLSLKDTGDLPVIAGKAYIKDNDLSKAGIGVEIGWTLSSHTPVSFHTMKK